MFLTDSGAVLKVKLIQKLDIFTGFVIQPILKKVILTYESSS